MEAPETPVTARLLAWRVLGVVLVGIGIANAFLPLLPTTIFLILGAWALGKGAPAWRARLLDHPRWGPPLRAWDDGGRVSRRGKRLAALGMAASFLATLAIVGPGVPVAIVGVTLAAVGTWLWRRPEP